MKYLSIKSNRIYFFLFMMMSVAAFAQSGSKTVLQWAVLAKNGEKNLAGANLTGVQLQKADLRGVDLSNANLTGVNLSEANLTGAKLYGCNLTGVNFTGANLTKANFLATNMHFVNLKNANLTQALLQEADLQYAILNGADMTAANLILSSLESADLQNANLSQALFVYESSPTPQSTTVYENKSSTASGLVAAPKILAPEIVETEALGLALEKMEKTKTMPVKLTGAKINSNTKGITVAWAKKNGAVVVPALIK